MGFEKSTDGADITPASIEANDGFNSDIGDNVDYLDPRWLAETEAITYWLNGMSADGLNNSTSGSGLATLNNGLYKANTGTTDASHGEFRTYTPRAYTTSPTWDKPRVAQFAFEILDAVSDRIDYIVTGVPGPDSAGTPSYIGFKLESGTVSAVASASGTETTATIDASPSTGTFGAKVVYDPNVPQAEYYWDGFESVDATITSGFPSGTSAAQVLYGQRVDNTSAVNRRLWASSYRVVQLP